MDLNNKVAIVTGASKGIGRALAEGLLAKGMKVVGWSRSQIDLENENFTQIETDVSNLKSVEEAYKQTTEMFGDKIDLVINNAGLGIFKFFEQLTPEDWHKMFDVNVHGIFNVCKQVVPNMRATEHGTIVNISSIAGKEGIPEATGYCGTKFAVRGITQALQKELKRYKIRVMCVFPGSVNTDFFDSYPAVTANPTMMDAKAVAGAIIHHVEAPDNMIASELELRPIQVSYKG